VSDLSLQAQTLEALAHAHNYNGWIAGLALPYLGEHPLEVGSGRGDFAAIWLDLGVQELTVSEVDATDVSQLRGRFGGDVRVHVERLDITEPPSLPSQFSSVVFVNVLEHLKDDVGAVNSARHFVRRGGSVVAFVPAHPLAMSVYDHDIGHWRRYTKSGLSSVFRDAGVEVEVIRHVNAAGLLAWIMVMKLMRRTPTTAPLLRMYDQTVVRLTRRVETYVTPPFGQSLFAVGRAAE